MRTNRKQNSADSVRAYLSEMGRVPLLTTDQEIEYGRQVQQLVYLQSLKQSLCDEMGAEPENSEWADAAGLDLKALERLLHLGRRAKGKIIEANLRLVVSIAKKYQNRGLELLDLIQEGTLGLNRAAEKFDPARGYKFSTYATWWIRQAIARGLVDKGRMIRIPVHRCEKMGRYKKAFGILTQNLGRSPSMWEWAEAVGESVEVMRELVAEFSTPTSLDQMIGREEDTPLLDLLESPEDPDKYVECVEMCDRLAAMMQELAPRQRHILRERYGLNDGQEKTLEVIGADLNVTRERVRQLLYKAMQGLKSQTASQSH